MGGISLIAIWVSFKKKNFSNAFAIGTLVFAVVVLFFAKKTGTIGGEIRHTEIRSVTPLPATEKSENNK